MKRLNLAIKFSSLFHGCLSIAIICHQFLKYIVFLQGNLGTSLSTNFALSLKTSYKHMIFPPHRNQRIDLHYLYVGNIADSQNNFNHHLFLN